MLKDLQLDLSDHFILNAVYESYISLLEINNDIIFFYLR